MAEIASLWVVGLLSLDSYGFVSCQSTALTWTLESSKILPTEIVLGFSNPFCSACTHSTVFTRS